MNTGYEDRLGEIGAIGPFIPPKLSSEDRLVGDTILPGSDRRRQASGRHHDLADFAIRQMIYFASRRNASGPLSTAPKARTLRSWTLPGDSGLKLGPRGDKALYDPYAGIIVITPGG